MVPMQAIRTRVQFLKISGLSLVFCVSVVLGNISLRFLPVSFNQASTLQRLPSRRFSLTYDVEEGDLAYLCYSHLCCYGGYLIFLVSFMYLDKEMWGNDEWCEEDGEK
ncbi:hypothetical protein V6N13_015776 [Hibiscus sabdariffa]